MKIGYARVSTDEQNLDLQTRALKAAGCQMLFEDQGVSGASFLRPGLSSMLEQLRAGDILVVWRLDRLGRSLRRLLELIESLSARGIQFQSLTEAIDTTSCSGMLIFHMLAALAQFERSLIGERTRAGMRAARDRGSRLGRRPVLTPEQKTEAIELLESCSISDVAAKFNVHPRTIRRARQQSEQTARLLK
ncbi:recombinase family protein [Paraburkholderia sp. Ac-20336]|uniref:recombinase family protein n=1 Tax=unclassified Paraburkholderia TaxID=2615204 RepID=UPI00141F0FC8|nr:MULTISPECIES: recombinase family protein [unclassified Paraburkholderia]MBN3802387.1 recombinase family protein [Paraburkholderia sp. Ac-20336]MBN3847482.1 recombinase family protein [Paraburkholderia sp. Ac-20342]NIF77427.1 recombinase family protein [Paraburkholderia sp. Cy-641]